ncbi:MAG: aminoglycoside phosphotransferase family protein [Chloroflexi bacterium]|nr:MAG: aminoglycoside phosphotransferase family protein [Chloroflexota bacterium]
MDGQKVREAAAAALSIASGLGLPATDATLLHNSNKVALRLTPCDTFARVAETGDTRWGAFEVELARRLAATGAPVVSLEPRAPAGVYVRDGFSATLWTYYEIEGEPRATGGLLSGELASDIVAGDYADALVEMHAGMLRVEMATPDWTDRVADALALVGRPDRTPELPDGDRQLLVGSLRALRRRIGDHGAREQILHGEPHRGNVLRTKQGLLFVDLETCCRGPVEFDLAYVPDDVVALYPGASAELLHECRALMLAMVAAWRWDRDDQFPDGAGYREPLLSELREACERLALAR